MPQNCSADVEAVLTHVDQVLTNGSAAQKLALKANFGIASLTHDDDAAGALRNNMWDWQSLSVLMPSFDCYLFSEFFNSQIQVLVLHSLIFAMLSK